MLNFENTDESLASKRISVKGFPSACQTVTSRNEGSSPSPQLAGVVLRLGNDQMIFNEGDETRHFFKVVSGRVRLCKMRCDGKRQIVEFLIPGDIFGFEVGSEHTLIAEAIGKVVLERYSFNQIERLSQTYPNVRQHFLAILHRHLYSMQNHMVMLGRETAKERVASFLAAFAGRMNIAKNGVVNLGMGRRDIADYVGLALETVCRELKSLQRAGWIEILDRRRIAIHNLPALQSIAEGRLY